MTARLVETIRTSMYQTMPLNSLFIIGIEILAPRQTNSRVHLSPLTISELVEKLTFKAGERVASSDVSHTDYH